MRLKLGYRSIKFKTWLYFVLFTAFLMVILWILQVFFLNNFYEVMKARQTDKVVRDIKKSYSGGNHKNFLKDVKDISYTNDIYIYVSSFDGNTTYFSPSEDNTGINQYSEQINAINREFIDSGNKSVSLRIKAENDTKETLAYGNILNEKNKTPVLVYVFSPLWPVSSTVKILTNQLIYVSFISLLLACLISFYLSVRITRPIREISNSAERLGKGEYGIVFRGGRYTEINNLADTLTRASIELEKSDMLQKDLIANVSHDLRTPLTMIKSYAEMIRDISGEKAEKREEHLNVIIDESDRLNMLVDDLLAISKMQSGKMQINKNEFNITDAVKTILNTYRIMEEEQGYRFVFDEYPDFIVDGDEDKIKQVISNLISNGIKFCEKDKTIDIAMQKRGRMLRTSISDHGIGVHPDDIERIWERYYKSSSNMIRSVEGTGLGLAIIKEILTLHNTDFGVDSTLGEGTTFWFELPLLRIVKGTSKE